MIRAATTDAVYWIGCFVAFLGACIFGHDELLVLGVVGAALTAFPIYQSFRSGRFDPFDPPTISLLFSFQLLLRPFYWHSIGGPELISLQLSSEQLRQYAILATCYLYAGYVVYYATYYLGPPARELLLLFPKFPGGWSRRRTRNVITTYIFAGICCYAIFMHQVGGVLFYIVHTYMRAEISEGLGALDVGIQLLAVAALILFCYWIAGGASRKAVVLTALGVGLIVMTLGGRGFLLIPVLIATVCWHYSVKQISASRLAVLGLVIVVFAVAFVSLRAGTAAARELDVAALQKQNWSMGGVLESYFHDQNQLDSFGVLVADMPNHISFQFGTTWARMVVLPIPRALWKNKPLLLEGRVIGETFFGDKSGVPPGYAGTLYMNFHFPGIIFGFFALGVFHKSLREYLMRNRSNVRCVCFYATGAVLLYEITNLSLINWLTYVPFLLLGFGFCKGYSLVTIRLRLANLQQLSPATADLSRG